MSYSREELEQLRGEARARADALADALADQARAKLLRLKAERFPPPHVCLETIHPDLLAIDRLLKQRDDLLDLCGNVLATVTLPQNRGNLHGPPWDNFVANCVERFRRNGGEWDGSGEDGAEQMVCGVCQGRKLLHLTHAPGTVACPNCCGTVATSPGPDPVPPGQPRPAD